MGIGMGIPISTSLAVISFHANPLTVNAIFDVIHLAEGLVSELSLVFGEDFSNAFSCLVLKREVLRQLEETVKHGGA